VDNVSEDDWQNVSLSLVSGTPISFIQPIQQPLYRHRPIVPIPNDLKLSPQAYEPDDESAPLAVSAGVLQGVPGGIGGGSAPPVRTGTNYIPGYTGNQQQGQNLALDGRNQLSLPPPPPPPSPTPAPRLGEVITSGESGVTAEATGNEVGDLFEYRIDQPVTVHRDRSALIPIVQTKLEGERVSIYNEAVRRDRPMSGLRLKNISPLTLEGGSLTVLDGDAYAGEALMERLKPGENRFVSFALDLGTLVTTQAKADREPVFLVRALNGVFQAQYHRVEKKTYTITNQTDRPRVVYLEHPVRKDWVLSENTAKPASKTASLYRFRVEVEPRKTTELVVNEHLTLMDSYTISNLSSRDLAMFVSRRYIDDKAHASLQKILDLKSNIATVEARLSAMDAEAKEISEDQARLRENIKALKETAEAKQLIARYVSKANEQESRIEQITAERKNAASERARLQGELDAAIRAFVIDDRKL
jgi:hypothetical protein